jgi:hypothetical protein
MSEFDITWGAIYAVDGKRFAVGPGDAHVSSFGSEKGPEAFKTFRIGELQLDEAQASALHALLARWLNKE